MHLSLQLINLLFAKAFFRVALTKALLRKYLVQIIVNMYGSKIQWRLCHGLELHFSRWCWGACQKWWNYKCSKLPSDFDPLWIWNRVIFQHDNDSKHTANRVKAYLDIFIAYLDVLYFDMCLFALGLHCEITFINMNVFIELQLVRDTSWWFIFCKCNHVNHQTKQSRCD